ncbi:MAG TPA: hypothetical protein VGM83_01585 [Devosiaceae bacterium]|jgi:hypothetical protein
MTSLIDEMVAAARGCLFLLVGNRQASGYFDFSRRGLIGSFIALLAATAFSAYLPRLFGFAAENGSITRGLLLSGLLFAMQIGFAAIVLRQLKRLDGMSPYLVTYNWATAFLALISTVLALVGFVGDFTLIVVALVMLVIEINAARLIVTLTPLQIAMFLIAQVVGVTVGLLLLSALMPLPPEVQASLQSAMMG